MREKIRNNYNYTVNACYLGYITQAIINNLAPLLFLTFQRQYGLSLGQITFITTFNFLVQLVVDFLSVRFVGKMGYRFSIVLAHGLSALGLILLAVLPNLMSNHLMGIMIAVIIYAIGGGLIEVLISPIVEACPTAHKEKAMSLLHSFYCWGHVAVVLLSTLFFYTIGIHHWGLLAILWAMVPIVGILAFLVVPIYPIVEEGQEMSMGDLFKQKIFWVFLLLMVCAGASEQGMSQWSSAFAETGLKVGKIIGDLAGPCAFALLMGTSRALYGKFGDKISLRKCMYGSAILCVLCYVLAAVAQNPILGLVGCGLCGFSVGIFWPGTFSIASAAMPNGGTALFALMALAGDVGCSAGPTVVGRVADAMGGNLSNGLICAIIFPVLLIVGLLIQGKLKQRDNM